MASGIEIAGVVLAMLPLVVEIAKSYSKGANSIKNVVISERRDDKLQDFYANFWWETFIFGTVLRDIINGLPLLCEGCKQTLFLDRSFDPWEDNAEVERALLIYFGDEEGVCALIFLVSKVANLIDRLTRDESTKLDSNAQGPNDVYKRLKELVKKRALDGDKSTFIERFKFFKDEKNRVASLQRLKKWNKRLKQLSDSRISRGEQLTISIPSTVFSRIRHLFDTLIRVVGSHWTCNCLARHDAMVCLKVWPASIREGRPRSLEFNVLLPRIENQQSSSQWLEATVLVEAETAVHLIDKEPLSKLCDAFGQQVENALRLLVCEKDRANTLWQMRSVPRKYSLLNNHPPTTLYDILSPSPLGIKLKQKRHLAVTFAYAMLQCYPSSSVTDFLSDRSLHFYHLTATEMDFTAPFFSTKFHPPVNSPAATNMSVQHRSLPILRLGILLIEIHKGKLFESLLTNNEAQDSSPNRDLTAARRIVEGLEEWCSDKYKNSIRACLELPWIPPGAAVDFADSIVCGGFVEHVIKPLESELEHLFTITV